MKPGTIGLLLALLGITVSSHAAIYACSPHSFQSTPCPGGKKILGGSGSHSSENTQQGRPTIQVTGHGCGQTSVLQVMDGGGIIKTTDGHIFHVGSYGRFDTQLWLTGDDLLVCVTTGTVNGQAATAYTLRDLDSQGDDSDGESATLLQ